MKKNYKLLTIFGSVVLSFLFSFYAYAAPVAYNETTAGYQNGTGPRTIEFYTDTAFYGLSDKVGVFCVTWVSPNTVTSSLSLNGVQMASGTNLFVTGANEKLESWYATTTGSAIQFTTSSVTMDFGGTQQTIFSCTTEYAVDWNEPVEGSIATTANGSTMTLSTNVTSSQSTLWAVGRETTGVSHTAGTNTTLLLDSDIFPFQETTPQTAPGFTHSITINLGGTVNYGALGFIIRGDVVPTNPLTPVDLVFTYPENGTTTSQFSHFRVHTTGGDASSSYKLLVNWAYKSIIGTTIQSLSNSRDLDGDLVTSSTIAIRNILPATAPLFTTHITAEARMLNLSAGYVPVVVGYASTTYTLLPSAFPNPDLIVITEGDDINGDNPTSNFDFATSTFEEAFQVASSTINCAYPSSSLDLGGQLRYALCSVSYFLFVTDDNSGGSVALNEAFEDLQDTPPLGWFFSLADVVNDQVSSTKDLNSVAYETLYFNQSTTIFGNTPIVMVTSRSLDMFIGEEAADTWRDDIYPALLGILAGLFVILSIKQRFKPKK